jgi:serine/threonine-protein kinase
VLRSGDVLDDRYRLDGPVATGGMGEVWRATDVTLRRTVAVKLLRPALLADPQSDARFQAEARIMAALTHPNVINVYDYGHAPPADGGAAYLVMSYVDGQPLSRRITEAGRLSVAETAPVLVQAAEALHAAHRGGIIHCDVKPANLLIAPDGTVTLVDFGVARPAAVSAATVVDVVLGTALYMAPEQVTGRPVTPATDVYALGAVAYHCLAGQPPFTGQNPLQIALRHLSDEPLPLPPDVPPDLRTLIAHAMNKDPARRYPTATAFAAALRHTLAQDITARSIAADPPTRTHPPERTRRSRRRAAPVATAAATLLLSAGALAILLGTAQLAATSPSTRPSTSAPSANAVAAPVQTTTAARPAATEPDAPLPTVGAASTPSPTLAAQPSPLPTSAAPSATAAPSRQPTPTPSSTSNRPSDPPTASPRTTVSVTATPTVSPSLSVLCPAARALVMRRCSL